MKLIRSIVAVTISLSIAFLAILPLAAPVSGQDLRAALQRGYRTGYSDGYMSGYRDSIDNLGREVARHKEYIDADRAYNADFGSIEDYRDGYRQGFQLGYGTGFEKRSFDSTVPAGLARKGIEDIRKVPAITPNAAVVPVKAEIDVKPQAATEPAETPTTAVAATNTGGENIAESKVAAVNTAPAETPITDQMPTTSTGDDLSTSGPAAEPRPIVNAVIKKASYIANDDPIIIIPQDTELIIELQEELSTETNREGDRFTARIVSPVEIEGATVEGRIDRIQKPGRIKRRSQIDLSFDRIILNEERWSNFGALLTEVMAVKGDNIKLVDDEGTAIGKRSLKEDSIKIGAATGAGLGIGAITGGPVGAAVGAGVGAAFGVGAAVVDRGKHINLSKNQQLKIRVTNETKIR